MLVSGIAGLACSLVLARSAMGWCSCVRWTCWRGAGAGVGGFVV